MTENDWLLLSEWIDGTLSAEARAALEARFDAEPELGQAARRLQALESVAHSAGPTEADRSVASSARSMVRWPIIVALVVLIAVGLLGGSASSNAWRSTFVADWLSRGIGAEEDSQVHASTPFESSDGAVVHPQQPSMEPAQTAPHEMGQPVSGAPEMQPGDAAVAATMSMFLFLTPAWADGGEPDAGDVTDAGTPDAGTPRRTVRLRSGDEVMIKSPEDVTFPDGVVHATRTARQVTFKAVMPGRVVIAASEEMGEPELEITVEEEISPERTLLLSEGSTRRLSAPGMARWTLPDRQVARVVEASPFLDIVGTRAGQTTLEVWFADGQHRSWPVVVTSSRELLHLDVRRSTQIPVTPGSWARVTPAQLAETKVVGSTMLVKGANVGAGVLEVTDASGQTTTWDLVVGGADLMNNATATRTIRQTELGGALRMRRGETIAIEVDPSLAQIWGSQVKLWKKGNVLFVSSPKATEGMLQFHPRTGEIIVVIVVVDP